MLSAIGTDGIAPAADSGWDAVLQGLRADALDCLQTTVALIADAAHGSGTHLALGRRLRFPARRADGTYRAELPLRERLDEAAGVLGLRVTWPPAPLSPSGLRHHLVGAGRLYVVADAYDLPWVPYAGHRRMPHSFLLETGRRGYTVVDAYHNDTEWGPARPGAWTLSADCLDRALGSGALAIQVAAADAPREITRTAALADNAAAARTAGPGVEAYAAELRAGLAAPPGIERIVLDVWQLSRERLLHAAWLGPGPVATQVATMTHGWQRLSAQTYLAMRRAQKGSPLTGAVVDDVARQLHCDAALLTAMAAAGTAAGDDRVSRAVHEALRVTLGVDEATVAGADTLRALPGFDSFQLVEIIVRLEGRLGVQLPADAAADDLEDVDGLCRLFGRAPAGGAGGPGG